MNDDDMTPEQIERDKKLIASYTRDCDGNCGDPSPHNAHLTDAGWRWLEDVAKREKPRQWSDIDDVPEGVNRVRNRHGDVLRRSIVERIGWIWHGDTQSGPFTELLEGN